MPPYVIIYNPATSNRHAKQILAKFLEFLSEKSSSHEITVYTTEGKNHAIQLAEKAYKNGHREFICVGGDGTFNEMCQPLVGRTNIRVSLVPAGTGNDLAMGLGFSPKFSQEEWKDFFQDTAIPIDVGQCNERYFFNMIGIGFDALVASEFRQWKWIPQKWRYYPPIFTNLLFYQGYDIFFDHHLQKIFLLSIGNGRSSGGGIALTPFALINDGFLDVCWIENVGVVKRIQNLFLALRGKHTNLPFVHTSQISSLSFFSPTPCVTHIDGELSQLMQWNISIHSSALPMYVNKHRATLLQ